MNHEPQTSIKDGNGNRFPDEFLDEQIVSPEMMSAKGNMLNKIAVDSNYMMRSPNYDRFTS